MDILMSVLDYFKFFIATAAVFVFGENIIFKKGIDLVSAFESRGRNRYVFFSQGLLLTFMMCFSVLPMYIFYGLVVDLPYRLYIIPILVGFSVVASYFAVRVIIENFFIKFTAFIDDNLARASFSCALMMTLVTCLVGQFTFLQIMAIAFGTGMGYILANFFIVEGFRRISLSDVPRSFRGIPIIFIFVGILSLSIYGLKSDLPTLIS